jgi:hypothetical protein
LDEEVAKAVNEALEAGYRMIDTAYVYKNEAVIGKVLKEWFESGRIKREDIFITSKVKLLTTNWLDFLFLILTAYTKTVESSRSNRAWYFLPGHFAHFYSGMEYCWNLKIEQRKENLFHNLLSQVFIFLFSFPCTECMLTK